jgi:aldose 1-epimerase
MEITLRFGDQRAVVSPFGASLRRYYIESTEGAQTDLAWGYSGTENKKAGQGDVLIPFPSRIKNATYRFGGKTHELAKNDKEGPNAIHGFLRAKDWQHEQVSPSSSRFRYKMRQDEFQGYPFALEVEVLYRLDRFGLTTEFSITNTGNSKAPVGAGFHPYFLPNAPKIDHSTAKIPANQYLEFQNLLPTGKILSTDGTPFDFRKARRIGETKFNMCFADLVRDSNGLAWAELANPETGYSLKVWMDESFPYLVIYSGDAIGGDDTRRSLAIEPITCATDAFNHDGWGMVQLDPGEKFGGRYGVVAKLGTGSATSSG